jgi:hypothetical protein
MGTNPQSGDLPLLIAQLGKEPDFVVSGIAAGNYVDDIMKRPLKLWLEYRGHRG